MRIGINLLSWVPGRRGGVETYDRNLLRALVGLEGPHELVVFLGREAAGALGLPPDRLEECVCPVNSRRRPLRAWWEQLFLGQWVRRAGVEVLFCPHGLAPQRLAVPTVVLLHDLQVYDLPANFGPLKRAYLRRRLPQGARRAAHLITISDFSAQAIRRHLAQPPERVSRIWLAAGPEFYPREPEQVARVRERYGLGGPYLFSLGTSHRHKQLDRLVRVFARERQREGRPEQLILAGLRGSGHRQLEAALAACGPQSGVRHLGRVAAEDLPALYSGAQGLVFPSAYEGFGLPVVEAMACGCPVVCSRAASLPEVAGEAALFFAPADEQDLAACLRRLLEEPRLREDLRQRGLAQAARFTWEQAARQTLEILLRAGAGQPLSAAVEAR